MANNKEIEDSLTKFILKYFLVFFFSGVGFAVGYYTLKVIFLKPQIINVPIASFINKDTTAILATLEKTVNKNDNIDIEKTFENVEKHIEYLISLVEIQKQEVERIKSKNDITSSLVTLFGLIGFIIALGAALNFFERFKEKKEDLINEYKSLSNELNYENNKQLEILKTQLNNFKSLGKELSDENKKQIETLKAHSNKEIQKIKTKFVNDLRDIRLQPLYILGVSDYNKGMAVEKGGNPEEAKSLFVNVISKLLNVYYSNYNKPNTCYYLGCSYKELYKLDSVHEYKANAFKYLNEALELNKEESRITQIQKEIDSLNEAN